MIIDCFDSSFFVVAVHHGTMIQSVFGNCYIARLVLLKKKKRIEYVDGCFVQA